MEEQHFTGDFCTLHNLLDLKHHSYDLLYHLHEVPMDKHIRELLQVLLQQSCHLAIPNWLLLRNYHLHLHSGNLGYYGESDQARRLHCHHIHGYIPSVPSVLPLQSVQRPSGKFEIRV